MSKELDVKVGLSRNSHNEINLQIKDDKSSDRIIELTMTLEQFALMTTGLYGTSAKAELFNTENAGKERFVQDVLCPMENGMIENEDKKRLIEAHFDWNYAHLGWAIKDFGLSSQQNVRGQHKYIIIRYE